MKLFYSLTFLLILLSISVIAENGRLDNDLLKDLEKSFENRGDQTALLNAITNNSINNLALNHELVANHNDFINFKLKSAGITDQKGSGRCWLYAGLNVYTPNIMKQLDLEKMELSQSFLAFYDKLEKGNLFLEQIIALRDADIGDRKLRAVLESPFGDGGWYSYFTGLINKYGAVPKSAMKETIQSSGTGTINSLTNRLLRKYAAELRTMHQAGQDINKLRDRKEKMLADVYQLLALCYGEPPKEFEYRYEPKDDSVKAEIKRYTPRSFAKEFLGEKMPEYIAIMNDPNREYNVPYQGEWSRNLWEIEDFKMLNLPIEKLKYYTMKSLLDSQLVWFACDVGKEHYRKKGILATEVYQHAELLGVNFDLTKAEGLAYGEGAATHAMAIKGCDTTASGEAYKWLVENSWGTKKGDDGYWYMYDDWFDEYVYVVVIDKRLIEPDDLALMDKKAKRSELWDSFFMALKNLH